MRRQIKAKPAGAQPCGVTSATARRILQSLERMSSPLAVSTHVLIEYGILRLAGTGAYSAWQWLQNRSILLCRPFNLSQLYTLHFLYFWKSDLRSGEPLQGSERCSRIC